MLLSSSLASFVLFLLHLHATTVAQEGGGAQIPLGDDDTSPAPSVDFGGGVTIPLPGVVPLDSPAPSLAVARTKAPVVSTTTTEAPVSTTLSPTAAAAPTSTTTTVPVVPSSTTTTAPISSSNSLPNDPTAYTVAELLQSDIRASTFYSMLNAVLAETLRNTSLTFTILAPTNGAWNGKYRLYPQEEAWSEHARVLCHYLVSPGKLYTKLSTFGFAHDRIPTLLPKHYMNLSQFTKGPLQPVDAVKLVQGDIMGSNGVIHLIDGVLEPLVLQKTMMDGLLLQEKEKLNASSSFTELVQTLNATDIINQQRHLGATVLACHSIEDVNPIWIDRNSTIDVGQNSTSETILANATTLLRTSPLMQTAYRNETLRQVIQAAILPQNYYWSTTVPSQTQYVAELTQSVSPDCGNVWITKQKDTKLCFNNACVMESDTGEPMTTMTQTG